MPRAQAVQLVRLIPKDAIWNGIASRALKAVNDVARDAHEVALDLVPVRKIFRYGRTPRTNDRFQGRQEVRTLSLEEALQESAVRRRLFLAGKTGKDRRDAIKRGVGSSFATDAAGRRLRGSQSVVQTAQFSEEYRTFNRANPGGRDFAERRQITRVEPIYDSRGRQVDFRVTAPRLAENDDQADLSARGRYEVGRAAREGRTVAGGALRESLKEGFEPAILGRVMTARITVGNQKVHYAPYVEFGTRRSRAQPFMRPALAHARGKYRDVMERTLESGLSGLEVKI